MMEFAELKRRGEFVSPEKRLKTSCGGIEGSSVKEKKDRFGQRVAALQQLVSPFGKVLCMPYFQSNTRRGEAQEEMNLRSQGLCLVPVAKTLAIASSNGADIWAPPAA